METFSALLVICAGNSPVPGEFPARRPVTRKFDAFFDQRPNKGLNKQWWGWWIEKPSSPLWRHCNALSSYYMLRPEKRTYDLQTFLTSSFEVYFYVFIKKSFKFIPQGHDDVIKWKHFPLYWPFARGLHRSPVDSPHKGQWRGPLMFSLICTWING